MIINKIKKESLEYKNQLIEFRRKLHRYPELSFQEVETSKFIKKRLQELGIPILEGISGNSVVGYLDGFEDDLIIAFRADMDALPIQEQNTMPYCSEIKNVMHACGHDAHTATLLCFAEYLKNNIYLVKGRVLFIFQQGEELLPGGAELLIKDGVLKNVNAIFAWHIAPEYELGQIALSAGARTASANTYHVEVTGKRRAWGISA